MRHVGAVAAARVRAPGMRAAAVLAAAFALVVGAILVPASAFAAALDSGTLPAEPARLASQSLLLDVAVAGPRLVAVGERGHVLLSDDRGRTWRQARSVPTQNLLTAVCFSDEQHGIAVGHDEIVLVTADAGETWRRTYYSPEAQQPLLDVLCNGRDVIAVGAYSTYLTSSDRGTTWSAGKFEARKPGTQPIPAGAAGRRASAVPDITAPLPHAVEAEAPGADSDLTQDFHLNRIVAASGARLYMAAEAGHLYRSDDGGATWTELASPYEGSLFGVLPLSADALLAYGLRGHVFRSEDGGLTWRAVETPTEAMLNDAVLLPGGAVAIVGLSGAVLLSGDGGVHFRLAQQDDRKGLSAALPAGPAALITVGEAGVKRLEIATFAGSLHADE